MIAAASPTQRTQSAKLLVVDCLGELHHAHRDHLADFLRPGDVVIANDAVNQFAAIVFGAGDFHTRTEHRTPPPRLSPGDRLELGPLSATIDALLDHPRLVYLRFDGSSGTIWSGLSRHGRPIQYAHVPTPLALWDVWTSIAGTPAAFEPPSAGFALDWKMLADLRNRGIGFATLTHAAGISSTGDDELDKRLPFDEPYHIPPATAAAVNRARVAGNRIIAIGTTVVRALEHAGVRPGSPQGRYAGIIRVGDGLATQRIDAHTRLRVVDALLSGTHERGTSHYELLRAFVDDATLGRATEELDAHGYLTHEFGDSVLIERMKTEENCYR
jgi:S-adenosylmethionine:tRNA ribosyltransferase-isomerase